MSRRVVMLMLSDVGSELRVHSPTEHHQPECEYSDSTLSNPMEHRFLSKGRCLYRFMFLNPRDCFFDFLFGQQSTLDVFLHAPFLIDKHTDRQSEYPKLIRDFVVAI